MTVMVAVAKTDDVRARIEQIKELAGVEPERVGVGGFPITQLTSVVPELAAAGPIAVLDLGATGSELVVLVAGEPVYARSLPLGTEGLPGTAPKLAREVRVSLASHRAQGGAAPTEVVLCGGGAFVSGAESFLSAELEMPVHRLPAIGPALEMGERAARHATEVSLYAKALGLAVGLAGRGPTTFDLRRGALVYERGYAWVREKVPVLAGLAAVILVSFVFSTAMQLYAAGKEHDALDGALASVSKEVLGEETHTAQRANELLQQTGASDEDPMPHADAFDVMVRLSEAIPQSMAHDIEELDFQKGHVNVHGVVGTVQDAQSIAASLRSDKCLQEVKIARTSQVVGGERQKYVMELDLKCPEDQKGAPKKKDGAPATSATGSAGGK
jgi:general secretion pathway protein L